MATSDAPLVIGSVVLIVKNLELVGDFYRFVLGFDTILSDANTLVLGQGDVKLLELRRDLHAAPAPNEAGLFHNAFLLPVTCPPQNPSP